MAVVEYGNHYIPEEIRKPLVLREPMTWMHQGACRGANQDDFFPEKGVGSFKTIIQNYCNGCPVKENCLNFALDNYELGIWGGTTTRHRRIIRAKMVKERKEQCQQ